MAGRAALLIIDVLNAFDFDGFEELRRAADAIVEPIRELREEARRSDSPVIYVNDNYGRWHDERHDLVEHLGRDGSRGADLVRALAPEKTDYFIIKPEASGFYATTLPALLPRLDVTRLVLTGLAADICILFTASDAHMREYPLWVPADGVAGTESERKQWALTLMQQSLGAEIRPTHALRLPEWTPLRERMDRRLISSEPTEQTPVRDQGVRF